MYHNSPSSTVSSTTNSNQSSPATSMTSIENLSILPPLSLEASDNQEYNYIHLVSPPLTPRLRPIDSVDGYEITRRLSILDFRLEPNCHVNNRLTRDPHQYDKGGNGSRQLNKI
jgi:hypothetical protein